MFGIILIDDENLGRIRGGVMQLRDGVEREWGVVVGGLRI